jgi:hypothetical protein
MNAPPAPTRADAEKLTAFLPLLYAPGFQPVARWDGGGKGADGFYRLPYPTYDPLVDHFFAQAAAECWRDYNYNVAWGNQIMEQPEQIAALDVSQIRTLLTYCVRGERFSDGFWAELIEQGRIRLVLERLAQLAQAME